ncbi:MAG: LytR C-terminal domain-containing protein, partial [Actinomycetota bacterium]
MGKHSSDSQLPFIRSVLGWFLPWLLVAIVVAVGVWIAVDALGGGDLSTPPASAGSSSASPRTTPSPDEAPSAKASPEPKRSKEPPKEEPEATQTPDLITEGITVQVLNGTSFPAADDEMADQMASLGFDVLAVAGSSKAYAATTVFYSFPEAQEAAERLAARYGWAVSI